MAEISTKICYITKIEVQDYVGYGHLGTQNISRSICLEHRTYRLYCFLNIFLFGPYFLYRQSSSWF